MPNFHRVLHVQEKGWFSETQMILSVENLLKMSYCDSLSE